MPVILVEDNGPFHVIKAALAALEARKHWLTVGAQPSDRVARFLDAAGLMKRIASNNPQKAKPRKKRTEREAAQAEAAAKKAAEGADKPAA